MNKLDYESLQNTLLLLGNMAAAQRELGLSEARDMMDTQDTIGVMLDPSSYRLAHERITLLKKMADSVLKLAAARDELAELVKSQEENPSWTALAEMLDPDRKRRAGL